MRFFLSFILLNLLSSTRVGHHLLVQVNLRAVIYRLLVVIRHGYIGRLQWIRNAFIIKLIYKINNFGNIG